MKAIQIESPGGPEVLNYREVAEPSPGAIRVTLDRSFPLAGNLAKIGLNRFYRLFFTGGFA